ncbi:lipid kinase [Pectobacterium carotovorum subsp. carotovorum]|nr:lipid kinase [Pectobacterium carotovorum]MCL6337018.1 lipid kinase [Pectobacterium carotovorum subsp. carotovorum]MCL6341274.1 lipid kinase [Pectobacterium carotovorum subsp. carotovorum]
MTMSHYSAAKESGPTALLFINKQARNGDSSARYVKELLQQSQIGIVEADEKDTGSCSDIIRAYADRVDFVIIGGGDGTLNSAAPGLVDTGLSLGVLPLGTANDFARTVGIPREIRQAVQVIANGKLRAVDLGEVNGHLFFNVSSIGFSAALARGLSAKSKKRWGTLGYALAAFKLLKQSRPFRVQIEHDGIKERVRTVQVSVGNGRFYGGGMAVADSAAPDDGRLDVYSLEASHWWEMVALIPFIRKGTHGRWRKVRAFSARELTLSTSKPHDINADGELIGKTPAVFGIREKAIQVFAPPIPD